jgi:hypothetical protein
VAQAKKMLASVSCGKISCSVHVVIGSGVSLQCTILSILERNSTNHVELADKHGSSMSIHDTSPCDLIQGLREPLICVAHPCR